MDAEGRNDGREWIIRFESSLHHLVRSLQLHCPSLLLAPGLNSIFLQKVGDGSISLRSILVKVQPVACLGHNLGPERNIAIEVRCSLVYDTWTVTVADKKVILSVDDLETC